MLRHLSNRALNLQTPITQRDFRIENDLFVGPEAPDGRAIDRTSHIVDGVFDHDFGTDRRARGRGPRA